METVRNIAGKISFNGAKGYVSNISEITGINAAFGKTKEIADNVQNSEHYRYVSNISEITGINAVIGKTKEIADNVHNSEHYKKTIEVADNIYKNDHVQKTIQVTGDICKNENVRFVAKTAAVTGVVYLAAPVVISYAGFGAAGVAKASVASGIQSAWFGANVAGPTGAIFSGFQSIGAAGFSYAGVGNMCGASALAVKGYEKLKSKL